MPDVTKTCPVCKKRFTRPSWRHAKVCSRACTNVGNRVGVTPAERERRLAAKRAYAAGFYQDYPGVVKARVKRWKTSNRRHVNAQEKKYRNTPHGRERVRSYVKNRHHRKRAAGQGGLTGLEWTAIKKVHGFRCVYCGKKKPLTQDHAKPPSKGGKHVVKNVVPACMSCNSSKGTKAWKDCRGGMGSKIVSITHNRKGM